MIQEYENLLRQQDKTIDKLLQIIRTGKGLGSVAGLLESAIKEKNDIDRAYAKSQHALSVCRHQLKKYQKLTQYIHKQDLDTLV